MAMVRRTHLSLAIALVMLTLVAAAAPAAMGAGNTLYVDGKNGSDANNGLSWGSAFKTIRYAATKVPKEQAAAGWRVVVRGYVDYVYQERPIPGGYRRWGRADAPLIFQAEGWAPGKKDYTKPTVSGADAAPLAGKRWTDSGDGTWSTPWPSAPPNFSPTKDNSAIFQDELTWLWQRTSLTQLEASARTDKRGGYYWKAGTLYVSTVGGVPPCGSGSAGPAACVSVDVPMRDGFYFAGTYGASYVQVNGFRLRHFTGAIALVAGTDYSAAFDNIVEANSHVGIHVSGAKDNPAVGNQVKRNVGYRNTIQAIKVNAGAHGTRVCSNEAYGNGLQGIKVQGPFDPGTDPRVTKNTLVCRNRLHDQTFANPGEASSANGLTISDGALSTKVRENKIWDNAIGINLGQHESSGKPLDGTIIERNLIWSNTSRGLSLNDGKKKAASGTGRVISRFNLYWDNDIAIHVGPGATRKSSVNDTVHGNRRFGYRVGCTCSATSKISIEKTLITGSGAYGVLVKSGGEARLSYASMSGNTVANTKGNVSKEPAGSVNGKPPGYISVSASSGNDFLRISPSSYQYTAGPGGMPIGARY